MKEELIKYETAVLAKEKGFNINTKERFFFNSELITEAKYTGNKELYYAPTQSLLQKWLREEHNINVYCTPCEHDESLWYNNIASQTPVFTGTYEESLEVGLLEVLKLIKI